tara:strand:- start:72 stop:467 length:396 start_codon:yes stop_codon:yes gene_type:complete
VKVYEKHYALTSTATETDEVFALDFPQEAVISKLTIQQTAGTDIAYGAVLYNSDVDGVSADAKVKFIVVPEQNALAGDAVGLFQGLYLHKNVEGGPTVPVRKIYLQLNTSAIPDPSDVTWDVALAGEVVIQ